MHTTTVSIDSKLISIFHEFNIIIQIFDGKLQTPVPETELALGMKSWDFLAA